MNITQTLAITWPEFMDALTYQVTGMIVVFCCLTLLCVILSISGAVAVRLDEKKKAAAGSDQERWVGKAKDEPKEEVKTELPKEMEITQEMRQEGYDRKTTTDDHGMHIYGLAQDQNGTKYFMVKNSWGETGKYKGIWYASDAFVRYKTMNIVVHKDALPKHIAKKLGIK